nr:PREDICTED: jerky protein homolog-like [Megachile rotundata]
MASKKNTTTLTMEDRLKVLNELKTFSVSSVARKFNVHKSTICRIKNNAPKIMQFVDKSKLQWKRRRIRASAHSTLEQNLLTWFTERRTLGDFILNAALLEKAVELKNNMGLPSAFKVSKGWLTGFKKRHNIRLVRVYGESASADEDAATKFIEDFTKLLEEDNINMENIYDMDETGLLWKALPPKTLADRKEKNLKGFKSRKERIAVGLCANAYGTHKLMPLIINKYENPRALKHSKNSLPVVFKSQKNAWMTQTLFVDWYQNHFKPSVRTYQLRNSLIGKVILLVDSCRGHTVASELLDDGHFQIIYLPPNTTSLIQPMNQGIIAKLKIVYRQKSLRQATQYVGGINVFQKQYTLKHCIETLHQSWMEVSPENIFNAWKKIIPNEIVRMA